MNDARFAMGFLVFLISTLPILFIHVVHRWLFNGPENVSEWQAWIVLGGVLAGIIIMIGAWEDE